MTDSEWIPCADTASIDFQLHQTHHSRILLYYGNGSTDDGTGYNSADAMFEYMGYYSDYTDVWPSNTSNLEQYKVIFLLTPGNLHNDTDNYLFTPGQVAQIDLFLRNGGRLVVATDVTGTYGAPVMVENLLLWELNDLDVEFYDDGFGWAPAILGAHADVLHAAPEQLLDDGGAMFNVHSLDFNTAVSITVNTATPPAVPGMIAALSVPHPDAGDIICAADTQAGVTRAGDGSWATRGFAGDVVLTGDANWFDDATFMGNVQYDPMDPTSVVFFWPDWPADNENLLLNIINF
jgi:hypothetical protein